jgi:hypothetical protein
MHDYAIGRAFVYAAQRIYGGISEITKRNQRPEKRL